MSVQRTKIGGQDSAGKTDFAPSTTLPHSNVQTALDAVGSTASTALQNVVEDTTPQLGGDLDLNGNDITGTGDINYTGGLTFTGDLVTNGGFRFGNSGTGLFFDESTERVSLGGPATSFTFAGILTGVDFFVHNDEAAEICQAVARYNNASATASACWVGLRSRGTQAAPTVVQSGDRLSLFSFLGFDGTDYALAGAMYCEVDGTPGSNDMPGRIIIATTPDGSQTPVEAVRFNSDQSVDFSGSVTGDSLGYYLDKGSGANFWRPRDRVLVDAANSYAGTTDKNDGQTVISSGELNSFYLERAAAFASISSYGGVGVLGGAKASMRYSAWGYGVWVAGEVVTIGTKRGYGGRLYTATTNGTTGATPLTHTTGTASDGTVTWQFDDYSYTVPIGVAAVVEQDVVDGTGAWAFYNEAVRASGAGTVYAREVAVKNNGSDVVNNPYNRFGTGGGAIGDWFAAGGDASVGAPANPSMCAILIGSGASDWNNGIVFEDGSIVGSAIALAEAQPIDWYVTGGTRRGRITYSSNFLTFAGAVTGYSFDAAVAPASSDGAALGSATLMWSDLFLASGAVINFNNGDVTVTHAANTLAFAGASSGYTFDAAPLPSANDAAALGASGTAFADLFLASGAVINFNAGDITITHSANLLSFNQATSGYSFGQGPVRPNVDDGVSLGVSAAGFSDLFLAAGGEIRLNNVQLLDTVGGLSTQTATAAAIAAVGNAINTANKRAGKMVFDTTNTRLMVATGSAAADAWKSADGATTVTPA